VGGPESKRKGGQKGIDQQQGGGAGRVGDSTCHKDCNIETKRNLKQEGYQSSSSIRNDFCVGNLGEFEKAA